MAIAERIPLRPLLRVSDVTRAVCALPAVATPDWCDRAAACLCLSGEPAMAALLLAGVDEGGRIASREAVGVAATGAKGEDPALMGVRTRAHRLLSAGWAPVDAGRPTVGVLERLAPEWRAGPLGRLFGGEEPGEIAVAAAPLRGPGDLMAIAFVAPTGPAAEAAAVLEAVFGLLVSRAEASLGEARSWLTLREQEVLEQLTLGRSVKEIAEVLGRSPHTVHDHVKALHRKLSASTRGELIARALGHLPARGGRPAAELEPKGSVPLTRAG